MSCANFINTYAYDNLGRTTTVQQVEPASGHSVAEKRVDFAYNAAGQFASIARSMDITQTDLVASTTLSYDDAHRLTGLAHVKGTTTLADYSWTYDTAGRLTSVTNVDGTDDYTYDDTSQLTGVDSDYQTDESWAYDANGNRTNTGYTTGDVNRLTSDGTFNYTYDAEGNRTKKTNISTGDYIEYAWDHRNRLTSVTFRNSSNVKTKQVTYVYDVFDRRIAKSVDADGDGTIDRGERYAYDGADVALVFDDSNLLIERLLYGPGTDQPLSSEDASGDVLWFLADNQGTIRDVAEYNAGTDTTSVVNHLQYGGFGNITSQSNASLEPRHTYTGREWDADSELFYYRARWYDPQVGRFISEDPTDFAAGDANLSRYVGNSPTNFIDPTGLDGIQLFGQTWVAPWSPNASWNPLDNAGQYAKAGAQAAAGTVAGAIPGAVGGASIGGLTGTPQGLAAGALAGGAAGAAGFWEAMWADDIPHAMGYGALGGALAGPPAAVAPALKCRTPPIPAPRGTQAAFEAAQGAWKNLPPNVQRMMYHVNNGTRPLSDFTKLPAAQRKAILDYYRTTGANASKANAEAVRQLNQHRLDYLNGLRPDPPGGIGNFPKPGGGS